MVLIVCLLEAMNIHDLQCKPHASTTNYGRAITIYFLKTINVHKWLVNLVFPNPSVIFKPFKLPYLYKTYSSLKRVGPPLILSITDQSPEL